MLQSPLELHLFESEPSTLQMTLCAAHKMMQEHRTSFSRQWRMCTDGIGAESFVVHSLTYSPFSMVTLSNATEEMYK